MTKVSTVAALAAAGAACGATIGRAQTTPPEPYRSPWRTPWTYEGARGAAHWSELDSAYAACNQGREQSPIDIHETRRADLPALQFKSRAGALTAVINNAHTIRVNYRPGNGDSLVAGERSYELTQLHFHHPSEETVSGTAYPMETHLMYQAADGEVAGVAVFVKPGRANVTAGTILNHMPPTEGQTEVPGQQIDPGGLLPPDTRIYFSYEGSLTAPPCTEGVRWFVLKQPVELSSDQIAAFARLYPNNARPVQPRHGRVVRESR